MKTLHSLTLTAMATAGIMMSANAIAAQECAGLPDQAALADALLSASENIGGGGLGFDMWGTIVDHDGVVCAVAAVDSNGNAKIDPWMGSRVISAQKANTANAFSTEDLALSTANIFSAVQPGGSLYGLQHSNPVEPVAAYAGDADDYGTGSDAMVGSKVGGVNVFGGGLALYNGDGVLLGAIGVSGDSSCADHNIAWKTRDELGLANVPGGVSANGDDNIVYDIHPTNPGKSGFESTASTSGWGHPTCFGPEQAIAEAFPSAKVTP